MTATIINALDAAARLDGWQHCGGKSRHCTIGHDDGYGASAWNVTLEDREWMVDAWEMAFWQHREQPAGLVYVGDADNDWPGLAATIHAAIDAWEAGNRHRKTKDQRKPKATP